MLKMGFGALAIALTATGAAQASDWKNGEVVAPATRYVAANELYGRPSQLGLLLYPTQREAPAPVSAVMDCSTAPVAGNKNISQVFACYAQPQWPSSGSTETFEDGQRRLFDGQ